MITIPLVIIIIAFSVTVIHLMRKFLGPVVKLEEIKKPKEISEIRKKISESGYDFVTTEQMFRKFRRNPNLISSGDFCFTFFEEDDAPRENFSLVHKKNNSDKIIYSENETDFDPYRHIIHMVRRLYIPENSDRSKQRFYVMITKKSSMFELRFPFIRRTHIHFKKKGPSQNLDL